MSKSKCLNVSENCNNGASKFIDSSNPIIATHTSVFGEVYFQFDRPSMQVLERVNLNFRVYQVNQAILRGE